MTPFQKRIVEANPGNWLTDSSIAGCGPNDHIAWLYRDNENFNTVEGKGSFIISVNDTDETIEYWANGDTHPIAITEEEVCGLVKLENKMFKLANFKLANFK